MNMDVNVNVNKGEGPNAESFDLLAGQLRYAQTRGQNFLEDLVTRFERALPGSVRVVRQWRILGGKITEIDLDLGAIRYRILSPRPPIYTVSRQQVVHGIAVGTAETLAPTTWTDALVTDLTRHVEATGAATHTLRHLLEG